MADMTTKELVFSSLGEFGTSSAKSLSCYIKRAHGVDVPPGSVAGHLRDFVNKGTVGKSQCGGPTVVYWVIKEG